MAASEPPTVDDHAGIRFVAAQLAKAAAATAVAIEADRRPPAVVTDCLKLAEGYAGLEPEAAAAAWESLTSTEFGLLLSADAGAVSRALAPIPAAALPDRLGDFTTRQHFDRLRFAPVDAVDPRLLATLVREGTSSDGNPPPARSWWAKHASGEEASPLALATLAADPELGNPQERLRIVHRTALHGRATATDHAHRVLDSLDAAAIDFPPDSFELCNLALADLHTALTVIARDRDPIRHAGAVIDVAMTSSSREIQRAATVWVHEMFGAEPGRNALVDDFLATVHWAPTPAAAVAAPVGPNTVGLGR